MARPVRLPSHIGLALVALLWAVALWFYAREEMSAERDIEARLDFTVPEDRVLELLDPPAPPGRNWASVIVTVKGSRGEVYALESEGVRGRKLLDQGLPAVPVPVSLSAADFQVPGYEDVRIIAVRPSSVRLILAQTARKTVPVRVIPKGEPKKGYLLSEKPLTSPSSVEVRAPAEVLEKIEFVETEPIDISGKDQPFSISAALVAEVEREGHRQVLILSPERVFVLINISLAPVLVRKEQVPVRVLMPAEPGFKVTLGKNTLPLSISGPQERVAALRDEDIKIFADASGPFEAVGEVMLPVRVVLPPGLEVVPESVVKELKGRVEGR